MENNKPQKKQLPPYLTLTLIALGIVSSAGLYILDIFSMLGG